MTKPEVRVLMVCLGNICRSPLAEGVLRARALEKGFHQVTVDSAGTADYHVDDLPDWRSREVAKKHGFTLDHYGRQFQKEDFERFDHIFVMDPSNHQDVIRLTNDPHHRKKVRMLAHLDECRTHGSIVPDPYYDGIEAFESVYEQLVLCVDLFLDELLKAEEV
jgi:protein-tyrosine phosphatase